MIIQFRQHDIFNLNADYKVIFGHCGLNEMNISWREFAKLHSQIRHIENPFTHFANESLFVEGCLHYFISDREGNSSDERLREILFARLSDANEKLANHVITNGVDGGQSRPQYIVNVIRDWRNQNPNTSIETVTLTSLSDDYIAVFHEPIEL